MSNNHSVYDISDARLVERAVLNARKRRGLPKWSAVSKAFGLGSTYSWQLCQRFGIDPETGKKQVEVATPSQ